MNMLYGIRVRDKTYNVHAPFRGENFHEWPQMHEIRESFLPWKFLTIR